VIRQRIAGDDLSHSAELREQIVIMIEPVVRVAVVQTEHRDGALVDEPSEMRQPARVADLSRVKRVIVEVDGNLRDTIL
jgi:hypothetical protein